ncbi:glycoprotein [Sowthistle yellow vein virus]|uniref:Glycoprotein n=1 Tax=Sowthistle yellow vein virus TaxID=2358214 RepID=A0AAE7ADG3_9RHAB|nr:glycoprotein [Sowthistle yellow vein virus]QJQ80126.1 glycoprotein [Sowthistle yellow vein virus]
MGLYQAIIIITFCSAVMCIKGDGNDDGKSFDSLKDEIAKRNPIHATSKTLGYGHDSIQPYYICDNMTSGSQLPLNAWHYSCKQSCTDKESKAAINITRMTWKYEGDDIPAYKVSTNEVCYTAHENVWGYCSQTQTITPVATTLEDRAKIPASIFTPASHIEGSKTLVNSGHAPCEYLSDNTNCARDYVVTYRPGKITKKSEAAPVYLTIYGDGIRTNPTTGHLIQNDVAWFWNPVTNADTKCGWYYGPKTTCYVTSTSEVMYCPDIGYQYNIKTIKSTRACENTVYDIDGPSPFIYESKENLPTKEKLAADASAGKGDPDVNLIRGINSALDKIEITYCSSSCDLFSRGEPKDDDTVLETPIGYWRLIGAKTQTPVMSPCSATAEWKIKNPTTVCHGANRILVSNEKTNHVCSWNTEKDYIIIEDMCSNSPAEAEADIALIRENISRNKDISIKFWTGDVLSMKPPYTKPVWTIANYSYRRNPGWFSKVALTSDMVHTPTNLADVLTSMVEEAKQEVSYNHTASRSVKTLLFEEIGRGVGGVVTGIVSYVCSLFGGLPKLILLFLLIIGGLWILKSAIVAFIIKRQARELFPDEKHVRFSPISSEEDDGTMYMTPTAPKLRPRSKSRQLAALAAGLDI